MSNILISGCGMSFSGQERPTWVKVLKVCGLPIIDVGGPAVSNEWILNSLINGIVKHKPSHVICQLTGTRKLDVESNDERYNELVKTDSMRNFTYKNIWPSSSSTNHRIKKDYYKWLYSEKIDVDNTAVKLFAVSEMCKTRNIELYIIQGYSINWNDHHLLKYVNIDIDFNMEDYYKQGEFYKLHDHASGMNVPCKEFMKHFAKKVNKDFIKFDFDIDNKLKKFI